jgi:hypothetical protein
MRASGRFRVTKICELQIHISSIPESGKGRGECVVSMRDFNHKKVTQSCSLGRLSDEGCLPQSAL